MGRLRELAVAHRRRGRLYVMALLHKECCSVGAKLMKRLWRQTGLLVFQGRIKRRRIGTGESGIKCRRASMKNEAWVMDFVQDRTADGRPFRMLVAPDEYTRECLPIEVSMRFRGEDILSIPEMISKAMKVWCVENGTGTLYIEPGSPWQKGIMESFNG